MNTERAYTELPKTFTAWTSSRKLKSDWASFYGCLDVSVKMYTIDDVNKTLNKYFPNSAYAIKLDSVLQCAYFCTSKSDLFTFHKHMCKCIYKYELTSYVEKSPVCIFWKVFEVESVYKVYSRSRNSLTIFKFETDLRTTIIQKGGRKPHKHHCLAKRNGAFTKSYCNSTKRFTCGGGEVGYGTWTTAINTCAVEYTSLVKNNSTYFDYWLRYFMYEEDQGNEQCVAIVRDNISRSLTYQFRPCSDHVPVLCKVDSDLNHAPANSTEPIFDRTTNLTSSNMPDVQRPEEMVFVNMVLFGLCILVAIMIILRKRLTELASQAANKKFRRHNITEIPMVQTDGKSERKNGVCEIYNESWELPHNSVHMGELNLQDIVDVQTEESKT